MLEIARDKNLGTLRSFVTLPTKEKKMATKKAITTKKATKKRAPGGPRDDR